MATAEAKIYAHHVKSDGTGALFSISFSKKKTD
jgi:hypothetical protein